MDSNNNHHGGDGDQLPGCAACRCIGRICPPDCALAPHFDPGRTRPKLISGSQGRNVTECARSLLSPELRRIFVECAVDLAAIGTSAGGDGRRLLVEAVLSEAEKELEPPPEPERALGSTSSSSDPQFPSVPKQALKWLWSTLDNVEEGGAEFIALLKVLTVGVSRLILVLERYNQDGLRPSDLDGNARVVESRTSHYTDQNLGVNADQDHEKQQRSISMDDDGGHIPGCLACQVMDRICPPDCFIAPQLGSGVVVDLAKLQSFLQERMVIKRDRNYTSQELRRIYVECAFNLLLVKAVLLKTEKQLESPPELATALGSSSSSADLQFSLERDDPLVKLLSKLADEVARTADSGDDGGHIPGCTACQIMGKICPPDCPLASQFSPEGTLVVDFAALESFLQERIVIERHRNYSSQELRRMYVECGFNLFLVRSKLI